MKKYKVLETFELNGVSQEVDSGLELEEDVAGPFVEQGKLQLVVEGEAA